MDLCFFPYLIIDLVSFVWQYVRLSTATQEQRMADTLIESPILNPQFREPTRHFKFTDEGITNEIAQGRRSSSYFIPIKMPKRKGKQLAFETEWTQDRIEDNKSVNRIRQRVAMWREGGYVGMTDPRDERGHRRGPPGAKHGKISPRVS